jgi:hypothetical protein
MQGYRDGAICNDKHTPEFNAGCHDKQTGLIQKNVDLQYPVPQNDDKEWTQGYYYSTLDTSFCPKPKQSSIGSK